MGLLKDAEEFAAAVLKPWFKFFMYRNDGTAIWPDDVDEVPQWRLEREAWAAEFGVKLPNYRTKREVEQMIEACEMSCPPLESEQRPLEPALPVATAAKLFLDSIQGKLVGDDVAEYLAAELAESYLEWCAQRNLTPSAIDHVKKHMARMPGVHKRLEDSKPEDRRRRLTRWVIYPAIVEPELVEPLPMRLAA